MTSRADVFKRFLGKGIFSRNVTFHYVGVVKEVADDGSYIVLEKASWVADSGRLNEALKKKQFAETELYENDVYLNTASIVDFTPFDEKALPMKMSK